MTLQESFAISGRLISLENFQNNFIDRDSMESTEKNSKINKFICNLQKFSESS